VSEFVKGMLVALIPSLVVSVATAFLTVRLSLRQFHSQRWWELKVEAYSGIMEQLSHVDYCLNDWLAQEYGGFTFTAEKKNQLSERYAKAEADILTASTRGSYIISEDSAKILAEVSRALKEDWPHPQESPLFDHLEGEQIAVRKAIERLRAEAKRDLKVHEGAQLKWHMPFSKRRSPQSLR